MKLIAVQVSNRPIDPVAYTCIQRLRCPLFTHRDCSEIALARNVALTAVCELNDSGNFDCALLVDDDMVFTPDDVKKLTDHALATGRATSACYVGSDGETLMATQWKGSWLTGLGLMAVPMALLMRAYETAPRFTNKKLGRSISAFCATGIIDGEWRSEDAQLCLRLGGADLLTDVCAGHIKHKILTLNPSQVAEYLERLKVDT